MKKVFCVLLALLTLAACLAGCGARAEAPAPTVSPEPSPPAEPVQRAQRLLSGGVIPTDEAGLSRLRGILDEKLKKTDEAASAKGLSENKYYKIIRDELLPAYFENIVDAGLNELNGLPDAQRGERAALVAANMLGLWSELDDLSLRMEGYIGVCTALCEGDDMFNMADDAADMTGDGAWPSGYFFDDYLPPLKRVDSFFVCEEYLRGYGIEDATLCALGADGLTLEDAQKYLEALTDTGLYENMSLQEGGTLMWRGCWVGDDDRCCYVSVERAPKGEGSMLQDITDNREFIVMAGNFDFNMCVDVALMYYFL